MVWRITTVITSYLPRPDASKKRVRRSPVESLTPLQIVGDRTDTGLWGTDGTGASADDGELIAAKPHNYPHYPY